jgi:ABC-type transport system involved in cytochrome bd biosynthesis fused ATPase/permease subunit
VHETPDLDKIHAGSDEAFDPRLAGKTILAIAYKPALALVADHVLRLEQGRFIPQGVAA